MDSTRQHFAALLEAHSGIVFKVANAYARDPHDRQDLAQEIAAQLWRSFPRYDAERAAFTTWAYRIALNVAIAQARSARHRDHLPLDVAPEDHPVLRVDDDSDAHREQQRIAALYAVIERQSPMDRALLLLWLDERSQREIGEVLGISESNVATKLNRLKQRLRAQLDEHR